MANTAAKKRKGWLDRPDAHVVKAPGLQTTMACLMPHKTENEVYLNDTIDATELLRYLEQKNSQGGPKVTLFHCMVAAVTKMVMERPRMNYYVKCCRLYERDEISMSFVAKRQFADGADEELMFYVPKETDTINEISAHIIGDVNKARNADHGAGGGVNAIMDTFAALPRPVQMGICGLVRTLDYWGHNPSFLTEGDPNYSTVLLSNLGSIKCPSVYHHLNEYGTCSILLTIGVLHKEELLLPDGSREIRDCFDIGATLDERIADGFYFARSLKLIKYIFAHPEMLEQPLNTPSGFDYK